MGGLRGSWSKIRGLSVRVYRGLQLQAIAMRSLHDICRAKRQKPLPSFWWVKKLVELIASRTQIVCACLHLVVAL